MTQELYLAEIIEKSIGTYSNALTKSLSRHIARDILKHFIIKRMNTNEELKTRPDFEKRVDWINDRFPLSMVLRDYILFQFKDCFTTHVEPLQAENNAFRSVKESVIKFLENQPDKPYIANSKGSWTTHQLANEIRQQTPVGIEMITAMLTLTADLILRGKADLQALEKAESENQKLREQLKDFTDWCESMDYKPDEYYRSKRLLKARD